MNRRNRKAHQMAAKRALDTETMKQLKQHVSQELNSSKYYLEECAEISISKLAGQIKQDDFERKQEHDFKEQLNPDPYNIDDIIQQYVNVIEPRTKQLLEAVKASQIHTQLIDSQRVLINRLITALVATSIIALIFFGFTWWLS